MNIKRSLFSGIFFAAITATVSLILPLTVSAEDRVLNIYNWSDYIDESVIKDFEKETNIKITYDVFDSNEVLETKLLAGGSGYDLVVPSAYFLSRQIQAGIFQPLDKSKLKNLGNMWDVISERTAHYDPDNKYSINYMWGTTGIGYSEEKVKKVLPDAPLDSWDLILKPEYASKLAECGIYWMDAPTEMIPILMSYLGLSPKDITEENMQKVEELAMKVRPTVKKFHSSEFIAALANGDICLAVGWSGDMFQSASRANDAKNGITVKYIIPKEGSQMWFDQMAIPADAKHTEEAYAFMDYVMRPEVAAKISNYVSYANGNKASQQFINKDVLDNPSIYPNEEVMKRLYTVGPYDNKEQRLMNRAWTKIKSGE